MMNGLTIWAAAAAMALCLPGSAHADVSLRSTFGGMTFDIVDLDPADSIAPSVTWRDRAHSNEWPGEKGFITAEYTEGEATLIDGTSTLDPGPVLTLAVLAPSGSSYGGHLANRGIPQGGDIDIDVHLIGDSAVAHSGRIYGRGNEVPFVLSPNTELVVHANGWTSGRADDLAHDAFSNEHSVSLMFMDPDGNGAWGFYAHDVLAPPDDLVSGPFAQERTFSLTTRISNQSLDPVLGFAQFEVSAWVRNTPDTATLPPVPEPAAPAMFAAGAALLLAWRGMRRR